MMNLEHEERKNYKILYCKIEIKNREYSFKYGFIVTTLPIV
jgi:hypothetical protein